MKTWGNMKYGKDLDMQSPEPQITDNSFVQFAVILVAMLGTETLQTLTWTQTVCHIPSPPCSSGEPKVVSLHRQVQHVLTKVDMELPIQILSTSKM